MCACMPVPREARVMDPLELELQVIVSFETRYWEHQSGCLREEYKFLTLIHISTMKIFLFSVILEIYCLVGQVCKTLQQSCFVLFSPMIPPQLQ